MDLTTSNDEPTLGLILLGGILYVALNSIVLHSFVKISPNSLLVIFIGFVCAQCMSFSVLYLIEDYTRSFANILSNIWKLSTRSKSRAYRVLGVWFRKYKSGANTPKVLNVSPNRETGDVEIEVISSKGFGFIYGSILDISASPDEVEFASVDKHNSKFTDCHLCRRTDSEYKSSFYERPKSTCTHRKAICEGCIIKILNQVKPELDEYTNTEYLVAKTI
jgi:hypothetical protein